VKVVESSATPYISFVVAARNDSHGGNFLDRMQIFVDALVDQCTRHELSAELIIVEWNPPQDQKPLAEALNWPRTSSHCSIRIIRVPKALHDRYENSNKLPLHQFIAKNVGIRRARGEMVVATNADVVFSDGLMVYLTTGQHDQERFYRACRLDVPADLPGGAATPEKLSFCENNVIRSHQQDGTRDLKTGTLYPVYRNRALLRAVTWSVPFGFLPFLVLCFLGHVPGEAAQELIGSHAEAKRFGPTLIQAYWQAYREVVRLAKLSLMLRNHFKRPYTNASGDFTLMSKSNWVALRGYFEYPGFPRHIDGLLLYRALKHGHAETVLPEPAGVYHIEHGEGSGFDAYASGKIEDRLKGKGIPFVTSSQLMQWLLAIAEGGANVLENNAQWGLDGEALDECTILAASS